MRIAIIDYQAGNLTSVQRAIRALGYESTITDSYDEILAADRVIFPGVGAAATCMQALHQSDCAAALQALVAADRPLLGICVGMQLLFAHSEEDGGVECLGLIPGRVRRFRIEDSGLKVPHMGWNTIQYTQDPLWQEVPQESSMYFVHSYYCEPEAHLPWLCSCTYGQAFCAGIRRGNLFALQFHPEKSGPVGLRILSNFIELS